ncbi:MAG: sarcosine oxidase subunit alpha family protein [Brucellaceae bacterium]|nr:sarcosine oxidase subunit alpha family protein [Brucellaceae bacterium]
MSGPFRLADGGSAIDRLRPVTFSFDGKTVTGFAGDTVSAALLGAGQRLVARSFKYHRPRGVMAAGREEASALVTIGDGARRTPNQNASMEEIADGLAVSSQNRWPSLERDFGAVNQLFSPLFSAGFYYKTFIGPLKRSWMWYEPAIRRAAGMGAASLEPDPDRYETMNAFCDVAVVGGGVAGLAAALVAARAGARVMVFEDAPQAGGWMRVERASIDGKDAADWIAAAMAELEAAPNVTVLTRTSVHGYFDGNNLAAIERVKDHPLRRERHWSVRAKQVVLATGMIDRPAVFEGNDLPGVMLLGAGLAFARLHGVSVGRDVVVYGAHDRAWWQAVELAEAGVPVRAMIDPRGHGPAEAAEALAAQGVAIRTGCTVTEAKGGKALQSVALRIRGGSQTLPCDALLVSAGTTPLVHLASQAGDAPVWNEDLKTFLPGAAREAWTAAGALAGKLGLSEAMASGAEAGRAALKAAGLSAKGKALKIKCETRTTDGGFAAPLVPAKGKKAFVDLQHDVTADDVALAAREGFLSVEHLKRYTTLGMANDQGRTSNVNGLAMMAAARGIAIPEAGTTRFRPPVAPVTLGALAGRAQGSHFRPLRRTPMDALHEEAGAIFQNVGIWRRAAAYPVGTETFAEAANREAANVRANAGMCDVSTLGKILVQGPDAGTLVDLVYTNLMSSLPVGKARYGFMLRDDGFVFDDGTVWRLGEQDWLMTTTTANAGPVMERLEFLLATAWPDLKVTLTSVTDQWAAVSVAGPQARSMLAASIDGVDFSDAAFPFMAIRHGRIGSFDAMIARLSFSGELAYEVWCGADHGAAMWRHLMKAGAPFGHQPYGLEALGTLRLEKGHVTGAEIDGRVTLHDLGFPKMLSAKKDCAGKALALRPALTDAGRKQLVGLISQENRPIRGGSHLVKGASAKRPGRSEGHVTSMTWSPAMNAWIALALLEGGHGRIGETLYAADPVRGSHQAVTVADACFFDRTGAACA